MMVRNCWRFAALLVVMGIAGCSHSIAPGNDTFPQAWLEPGTRVVLPAPGLSPAIDKQQLLTGTFNGKSQSLLVMLHADEQKITLAGLSSVGIRLFKLTYDENGLPPASQVLADVMLSLWPLETWRARLPNGWTIVDKGNQRELRNASGKLVTEIAYLQRNGLREPISIQQHAFKYQITIQYLGE
jgi:hypothetical protein